MKKVFNKYVIALLFLATTYFVNAQNYLINEDFSTASGTSAPSGWAQVQIYATAPGTDYWHFDNPGGRTLYGPMSGTFAIFDSDNYSNNAGLEIIALESPAFNANGVANVTLKFDYQFGTVGSGYVEVWNGDSWNEVRLIALGTGTGYDSAQIDISKYAAGVCDAKIRFRWYCQSGGYWAVDNVRVQYTGSKNTTDANMFSILSPVSGSCASAAAPVQIKIKNNGTGSISNIPVKFEVFDGTSTSTISGTYTSSLAACSTAVFNFTNTINISNSSKTYSFKAYTELSGDQNKDRSDTAYNAVFNVMPSPLQPSASTILVCGGDNKKIGVPLNSGDKAFWYENSTATKPFVTIDSFLVKPYNFFKDTSVYVETFRAKNDTIPKPYTIPATAAFAAGVAGGTSYYITIEAFSDLILDSLGLFFRDASGTQGDVYSYYKTGSQVGFETTSSAWTFINSHSVISRGKGLGAYAYFKSLRVTAGQKITIYITCPVLSLEFQSGTKTSINANLKTESGAITQGSQFSVIQTLNFSAPGQLFYGLPCVSSRVKITLDFEKKPASNLNKGTPFEGTFSSANDVIPDALQEGSKITYELTPPSGYANSDYNTKWKINNISIKSSNGGLIKDTSTTAPGSNNATITYTAPSTHVDTTIKLTYNVQIIGFCDTTIERNIYVAPIPVPAFTSGPSCLGKEVEFFNTSSILKGSMTYKWDFGDGTFSDAAEPKHIYNTPGNFTVKLIVTSGFEIKDSLTKVVNVVPIPEASFVVTNACEGDSLVLRDNSVYSGATPEFTWMFDDGSPYITETSGKIKKIYATPGVYSATMKISVNNCVDIATRNLTYAPRVSPEFTFTVGNCDNADVTFTNTTPDIAFGTIGYTWKFGDNKTSNAKNPLHTYNAFNTYNVTLITSSDLGCKDSVSKTVSLKESPKIGMSFSGPNCTNAGTSFNNTTTKPAGTTVSYVWDFGDGATATDEKPPHDYVAPGTYKVNLTATSSNGCNSTKEITVTINEKPTVKFISDKNNTCAGNEIQFNNQVSYSGTGLVYNWKFGNGQTSNLPDPTHTYTQAGSYKVTLVADVASCKDSASMTVDILAVPVSTFANVSEGLGLGGIVLTPDESNGAGTYRWIFGDNTADGSGKTSFTHRYPKVGYFKTCLVRKNGECESTSCENIVINAASVAKEMETVFNVYPNPSNGLFKIHFNTEVSKDVKVTVSNAIGEVISAYGYSGVENGEMSIDMTNVASGVYLINIENNHTVSSKKITVVR